MVINRVTPQLKINSRISPEIVFHLYLMVFERIDPDHGSFTPEEMVPTPADTRERVAMVLKEKGCF